MFGRMRRVLLRSSRVPLGGVIAPDSDTEGIGIFRVIPSFLMLGKVFGTTIREPRSTGWKTPLVVRNSNSKSTHNSEPNRKAL